MFQLNRVITRDSSNDLDDISNIKLALTSLGYYDDTKTGLSTFVDDQLFNSIKLFQKGNSLKVDGIIKPEGPTQAVIKKELSGNKIAGNAFQDFIRNRDHMNKTQFIGGDKYFHCKANYEAASRGWFGNVIANVLSDVKELKDTYITGYTDSDEDQAANHYGRNAAKSKQYNSSKEACAIYRPEGLNEDY